MQLIKIINQSRRDFQGIYKCEFCNNIETDKNMSSYDDDFFHNKVTPNKECNNCQKSTVSEKGKINYIMTKYPKDFII
jgi:hypothetical protein